MIVFSRSLIILVALLIINLIAIWLVGHRHPVLILIAFSTITFLESGVFALIGGIILMVGGFPSISKAIRRKWSKELEHQTLPLSYVPLLVAGLLILVSVVTSFFVY